MDELEKLANQIITQNVHISLLVSAIENKYPGKTLADLLVESILTL